MDLKNKLLPLDGKEANINGSKEYLIRCLTVALQCNINISKWNISGY